MLMCLPNAPMIKDLHRLYIITYRPLPIGKVFLLIVDSHSKWLEVHVTINATATTIEKLQITFAVP